MPTTVTPRIYTGAFPLITVNSLRYVIYAADNPLAEVASKLYSAPHPIRAVSFPGLDRVNYIFRCFENSGAGDEHGTTPGDAADDIRNVVDDFNFNPDTGETKVRPFELVEDGVSPLDDDDNPVFANDEDTAVLDGTNGKPDWRGWNIIINPPGLAPLLPGVNYTWDPVTGTFHLIDGSKFVGPDGSIPGTRRMINFEPQVTGASPGVPAGKQFSEVLEITDDYDAQPGDLGKKWLFNPSKPLIRIKMPARINCVSNRVTWLKAVPQTADMFCVELYCDDGSEWQFGYAGRTSMYLLPNESFEFYNDTSSSVPGWYTQNEHGNFLSVGESVTSENPSLQNMQVCDGSIGNIENHARYYNDNVLQLDPAQTPTFAQWEADATLQSKPSLANVDGNFHFPNRLDRHERSVAAGQLAGVRGEANVGLHTFFIFGTGDTNTDLSNDAPPLWSKLDGGNAGYKIRKSSNAASLGLITAGSGQNRVKDFTVNIFVKL